MWSSMFCLGRLVRSGFDKISQLWRWVSPHAKPRYYMHEGGRLLVRAPVFLKNCGAFVATAWNQERIAYMRSLKPLLIRSYRIWSSKLLVRSTRELTRLPALYESPLLGDRHGWFISTRPPSAFSGTFYCKIARISACCLGKSIDVCQQGKVSEVIRLEKEEGTYFTAWWFSLAASAKQTRWCHTSSEIMQFDWGL